jgi:hypothetical protein
MRRLRNSTTSAVTFTAVLLAALAGAVPAAHAAQPGPPARTGDCRWARGRFAIFNGSGVRRIWILGTRRIVAIPDAVSALPKALADYQSADPPELQPLYARFHICALEDSRPGRTQHVRVDAVEGAVLGGRALAR